MKERSLATVIHEAVSFTSKLPSELLAMDGYTTPQQRLLLNRLCDFNDCVYLEVGVFLGASLLSAAYRNPGRFFGIDNFVEGTRNAAHINLNRYSRYCGEVCIIESDFWQSGFQAAEVNALFFDANVDTKVGALALGNIYLAKEFIVIVDNWSYIGVRDAFYKALVSFGWHVSTGYVLQSKVDCDINGWGNGWFVAVVVQEPLRTTYPEDMVPILKTDIPLYALQNRLEEGLYTIQDYVALHESQK